MQRQRTPRQAERSGTSTRFMMGALLVLCFALTVGPAYASESPSPKPNVIVIVLDDFGWADLGCYGSTYYRTPNVDALAASGMRFTDAYAACPVCSPSRAALLTGQYPARLHLTDWLPGRADLPSQKLLRPDFHQELRLEELTLAEALKSQGYTCASIGKWHLGGSGFDPRSQGFDSNVGGNGAGSPLSYFAPYRRGERVMPGLEEAPSGEYLTDRLTDAALSFIDQQREKPFFLYLSHFAVHIPLQAKSELVEKYSGSKEENRTPTGKQDNPVYAAMIESVDQGIGKLIAKLEASGLSQRTLIVFTSDNGGLVTLEGKHTPATSNAPLREGKGYLYEGGIRVPLLISWPGKIPAAQTSSVPVCGIDVLPTVLQLADVEGPQRDGVSLAPLLLQTGNVQRESLFWHYPHYSNQGGEPGGVIRQGRYKLIEFYENGRRELYDLEADPREIQNLAEKMPDVVQRLAGDLDAWRRSVDAQTNRPNPDFVANPQGRDGIVTLPAKSADVEGVMLRFEPQPHKNTLGFWTRVEDWAHWDFVVERGGEFRVEMLQGCGNGSGGSEVEVSVADQKRTFTVEETGGFQSFVPRDIGTVKLPDKGQYTLTVKPIRKPGVAVMDLRQVRLIPVR